MSKSEYHTILLPLAVDWTAKTKTRTLLVFVVLNWNIVNFVDNYVINFGAPKIIGPTQLFLLQTGSPNPTDVVARE